jgi:hypothetical protein
MRMVNVVGRSEVAGWSGESCIPARREIHCQSLDGLMVIQLLLDWDHYPNKLKGRANGPDAQWFGSQPNQNCFLK